MNNSCASACRILFVDDEAQARKYFHRAYARDFEIVTVADAREARHVLETDADGIGVIITDQRMPGESGVSLLSHVRQHHPQIVRMLTTAYSDIDSAIDAVNDGAVFRYITKPWDVHELRGILRRAMEMHQLQRERDALLREKLAAAGAPPLIDRLRGFVALAAALKGRVDNPLHGLQSFTGIARQQLHRRAHRALGEAGEGEHAGPGAVADQFHTLLMAVDEVVDRLAATRIERMDVGTLLSPPPSDPDRGAGAGSPPRIELSDASDGLALEIHVDAPMVRHGLDALARALTAIMGDGPARVRASIEPAEHVHEAAGVRITLSAAPAAPSAGRSADAARSLDPTVFEARLLAGCLVAAHHRGRLVLARRQGAEGLETCDAQLELPGDPERAVLPPLGEHWLERALEGLEAPV